MRSLATSTRYCHQAYRLTIPKHSEKVCFGVTSHYRQVIYQKTGYDTLMESPKPPLPDVADSERSPLVDALLERLAWQQKKIEALERQILTLKGETTQPTIKPSTMDKETDTDDNQAPVSIGFIKFI